MKKSLIYLLLISFVFITTNIKANAENSSMVQSMQIEEVADISISDESSSMTFAQLAEQYASIITDKNAATEQLEALGNLIKLWMDTLSQNSSKDQMFNEYSKITSTLSCMLSLIHI